MALAGAVLILVGVVAGRTALAAQDPGRPEPTRFAGATTGPSPQPPAGDRPASNSASASTPPIGASTPASGSARRTPYSLLQMNLCLSGVAECFDDTQYPKVVGEAIDVIAARKPSAVSFNEACSGDITRIAAKTRYHLRFAPVLVRNRRLPCVDPADRGVFGIAVITKEPIRGSVGRAFAAQVDGEERRRFVCVRTVAEVSFCTAHLTTRGSEAARAAHQGQCEQFATVLASQDEHGPVIGAGDINRQHGCAPAGVRTLTDARASQLPGKQHSYVSAEEFRRPQVRTLTAAYSDHDFMLTRTRLLPPRRMDAHAASTPGGSPVSLTPRRLGFCPRWSATGDPRRSPRRTDPSQDQADAEFAPNHGHEADLGTAGRWCARCAVGRGRLLTCRSDEPATTGRKHRP